MLGNIATNPTKLFRPRLDNKEVARALHELWAADGKGKERSSELEQFTHLSRVFFLGAIVVFGNEGTGKTTTVSMEIDGEIQQLAEKYKLSAVCWIDVLKISSANYYDEASFLRLFFSLLRKAKFVKPAEHKAVVDDLNSVSITGRILVVLDHVVSPTVIQTVNKFLSPNVRLLTISRFVPYFFSLFR